jgi:hypothetical protein
MEVHHHPHSENLPAGQAGKRFKEYFLEFIMIFLAVTMGFFAETIRENVTEHRRAKEFAESMVQDLREDTAQLRSYRGILILQQMLQTHSSNYLPMLNPPILPQANSIGMVYSAVLIVILYPMTRHFSK